MQQSPCIKVGWKRNETDEPCACFYIYLQHTADHYSIGRIIEITFNMPIHVLFATQFYDYETKDNKVVITQNCFQNGYGDTSGSFIIKVEPTAGLPYEELEIESVVVSDKGYEIE